MMVIRCCFCILLFSLLGSFNCLDFLSVLDLEYSRNVTVTSTQKRLWIYSTLHSTPDCGNSNGEYAYGVLTDSCVTQSPFLETFVSFFELLDVKLAIKSFKIEGEDCASMQIRLFEDPVCTDESAVPSYLAEQLWNYIISNIDICTNMVGDFSHYSRLFCVPAEEGKFPHIRVGSLVAR